jgi:hypothetical protein
MAAPTRSSCGRPCPTPPRPRPTPARRRPLPLEAAEPGRWGDKLQARIDHDTRPIRGRRGLFNLLLRDTATGATERHGNLSLQAGHPRHAQAVLTRDSALARLRAGFGNTQPGASAGGVDESSGWATFAGGQDGATLNAATLQAALEALRPVDLFNLLVVPELPGAVPGETADIGDGVRAAATALCVAKRAVFVMDPPAAWSASPPPKPARRRSRGRPTPPSISRACSQPIRSPTARFATSAPRAPSPARSRGRTRRAACGRPRPASRFS